MLLEYAFVFLFFTFKDNNLGENWTNLEETLKKVGPHGACFFQLQESLALGGFRAPPSAKWSGGQDCGGKVNSRGLVEHWCVEAGETGGSTT